MSEQLVSTSYCRKWTRLSLQGRSMNPEGSAACCNSSMNVLDEFLV